ncbi:MAG: AMP-binding protein [Crocinitomicaceae bacterium]
MNHDHITIIGNNPELLTSVNRFIQSFIESETIAIQTSGSTGKPKKYNVKKIHFMRSAKRTCDFFDLHPGDTAFLCISPEYIGGKMMILRALERNLKLEIGSISAFPFEKKSNIDLAAFVPLQINCVLNKDPDYLKQIKNIIIGGGAIDPSTESQLVALKINAYSTFGMTETLSHIALRKVGTEEFKLLDGVKIQSDDKDRLIIMDPEVTGQDKIQTNDIVEITSENSFIWKGRFDNIINSGGVKMYPEVIEKKISPYLNTPFFIAKEKDLIFGEKVILIVEGKEKDLPIFHGVLSKFEVPKKIYFIEKFAYTATNKINRNQTLEKLKIGR